MSYEITYDENVSNNVQQKILLLIAGTCIKFILKKKSIVKMERQVSITH